MDAVDLHSAAEDYLALRRAMGYRLDRHDHLIDDFLNYLQQNQTQRITVADAVAWACLPPGARPRWHAARLAVVRGFAAYVHAHHPNAAEPIPARLIPNRVDRLVPYLYRPEEVVALMEAGYRLQPPIRGLTLATIIGLMAATGIRIGEALALDVDSLDASRPAITVCGKYHRYRTLPIDASVAAAVSGYVRTSRHLLTTATPPGPSLFLTSRGTRPRPCSMQHAFRQAATTCRIGPAASGRAVRLHDLRHAFAVNTLIDAHDAGVDVDARISALASYLGHVSAASSYWYLTASPELLHTTAARLQASTPEGQS